MVYMSLTETDWKTTVILLTYCILKVYRMTLIYRSFQMNENYSSSWPLTVIWTGCLSPPQLFLNLDMWMENYMGTKLSCTDTLCSRNHFYSIHCHYLLIYLGFLFKIFIDFSGSSKLIDRMKSMKVKKMSRETAHFNFRKFL